MLMERTILGVQHDNKKMGKDRKANKNVDTLCGILEKCSLIM